MPNYRQKNKRNKNKNRQKNQQQQQQQQQNKNKNQIENQQQPEIQQTDQNRQPTHNKGNQSQGQSSREQYNQQQQQQQQQKPTIPPKSPKSPKSPTPTATQTPRPARQDEPRAVTSPQPQPQTASSEDAREVDCDAPAAALNQCHNLNSNEPTTSHQVFTTAVEREECNRVEDADAQLSKLDNTEATHSDRVCIERTVGAECDAVQESTMGNKDSKAYNTSEDAATLATPTTATSSTDLCGMSGLDRNIAGARELDELHAVMPKTLMAKVIVHRIARETREGGDIDKVEQVASVGENLTSGTTGELKVEVTDEQKAQMAASDGQIEESALNELVQNTAKKVEVASEPQRSKVIIHKIEQEQREEQKAEQTELEPKVILHAIQQGEPDLMVKEKSKNVSKQASNQPRQSNADKNVIVHKIVHPIKEYGNASQTQHNEAEMPTVTPKNAACVSPKGMPDQTEDTKVIIHHIQLESTSPINYRVDSPDTDSSTSQLCRSKQTQLINKSIVQIQELSDESSSECNDNPPVISEAESETESMAGAYALDYSQAVRTLSSDSEESYEALRKPPAIPSQEQQDLKQRRAQKRVALETHFLPQLLSPRYLDSIIEENSDMSDARSDCSENPLMAAYFGDDLHDASASKVRKANEVFPRSNLDFTRRHVKKQLGAMPKKPLPIREEPVAMVVAAKLIENAITAAQECCTRLSSEHTPESEAAEVIYLSSSASSSLSDLMELDTEGDCDNECGNSSRSTIDLDTDAKEIIRRPSTEECVVAESDSRESTPVNQASTRLSENNGTQKILANNNNNQSGCVEQTLPAAAAVNGTNIDTAKITNPIEYRIFENLKSLQLLTDPNGERALSNGSGEIETSRTTTVSKHTTSTTSESETETETDMSSETTTERCEYLRSLSNSGSGSSSRTSSIDAKYPPAIIATSDSLNVDPAVLLENIELEMNSVRDILNSHTIETMASTRGNQHVSDTRTSCELKNIDHFNSAKNVSPSPPPIPPPPTSASASDFHSDFTGFQTQPTQPTQPTPPSLPARAPSDTTLNSASTLTTEQTCAQPQTTNTLSHNLHNALASLSLLARQESAESHCSDSTQHSQCTAINVGSRPSTDHELTPPLTATSPITDTQQQRQPTERKYVENSEIDANTYSQHPDLELLSAQQKDASIKKLRLLCTETLASMPYGEQVLVELATVAQNISELQSKTPTQTEAEKNSALAQGSTNGSNMPYPLPQLPHINELQLSIADDRTPTKLTEPQRAQTSHSATSTKTATTHAAAITQLGDPVGARRDLTTASAKLLHSPPPPPVPAPPARYSDAPWVGMPTAADPNVLVCLSPAQQQHLATNMQSSHQAGVQQTPQPDQLLDAHQKFLERRGYHEYTDEQVKSLNANLQQEEQQILKTAAYMKKLRKSLTPPPPVPPPPVPAKNAETAAKAQNQARTAASSSYASSGHSQCAYDAIQDRNANEQKAANFANGEQQQQNQANQSEQKRLLTLIQNADTPADALAVSVDGSSSTSSAHQQTSSLENNSRQTSATAATAAASAATVAAQGGVSAFTGKQPTANADTRQYSNANASESTSISRVSDLYAANNYTKNSFPSSTSTSSINMQSVESELAKMFPSMGSSDIFDSNRKRFSNIEYSPTAKDPTYCAQLQSTLPKRYSNIETHSYEAKKRMENGQMIYDYSNSSHEHQSDGDKSLESASTPSLLQFPVREPSKESLQYPVVGDGVSSRTGNSEIMSAIKLNTTENAKTTTQETKSETRGQTNGTYKTNFAYPGATSIATATSTTATTQHNPTDRTFGTTATTGTTIKEERIKNSQEFGSSTVWPKASSGGGDSGNAYEEFRHRAKATAGSGALGAFGGQTPATAPPLGESNSKHSPFNFQHDKLFKDFDALSQQLHMELEEGKTQRQQREKSASLFDLNRTQWNFKDHFDELKQQRHEHMQELEREIERSMHSRQLKGWANGGSQNTTNAPSAGRTYEIPIQIEQNNGDHGKAHPNCSAHKSERSSAPRELTQPRSYNIPIVLENGDAPMVPPPPTADYDTVDDASRFRRAESMFNLSDDTRRTQTKPQQAFATYERPKSAAADDWARYASDFGSSENITRPFAREVEICYQRQRPRTIRAPRLTASTNDLSSYTHSYDNYNAYNAHRSHAPMLQSVAQHPRPHHGSCYSVLERDPNPTYISTTTRRGVSPAPVSPAPQAAAQEPLYSPHAPERQRRASLPREIQEQQLKYISNKEEELRMEFERLRNERRRLMEELNTLPAATLQMPQHPMRDIYRPVPKLPTLTEDEVFRQQMAEEWLSKVAEREERRLQKIIKISKVNETQQGQQPPVPPHPKTDISDEFLKRVQERRAKLAMPADSDWESGAESQPVKAEHASESDVEVPPVKVIEGKSEADLRQLPRHLREFARFSNRNEEKIDGGHRVVHEEEERRQEANDNSMSSALKKSSVVKTVKIATPEIVTNTCQRVAPNPVSVQQQQQQQQQGHSRTTSGGETAVTRHSHISTATSSTHSSYETHAKLQQTSISSTFRDGGAVDGAMGGVDQQQLLHSHPKHHNHHQQHHHHHQHCHSHSHKASNSRPPAPHVRTCKKTRFLLEPKRRSWSESDLLKEIDSELKLAKGFLYANVFKVKHEYMSEPETKHDRPKKMAQLGRRQVDGIGPVTNDGMPIILRSEVKEPHQHEWYKRLYQTIHKQKSGDDYVIRYKCQRARPQLKSTGYQSEPEPNYDSDYSTVKYRTLDRRRLQSVSSATNVANRHTNSYQDDNLYGTMPNPIKSEQNTYKNQPGRIEDYVTGRSSVSEKERKEWWDEVMDIFNGHLEQTKLSPLYTEGNLSRALAKESGYASDSNLVFRKRDVPQASPLSPVEQKQAYKTVQAGGEPPLFGFRKPAPERPKESPNRYLESDVNIHFKTPIRHEYKQAMSDEDLAQRQAEQMQKLYQEERRRKYLQELQDMNARRHTDNFTPTQKSPIPLNRYDDFQSDLAPKSPNAITTRTAARALFNFQGQNARELTFKKGDIIYIRRQIDRNWYEGEYNAMIGLLPVSYVEVVNKEIARQQPKKPSEGQARAKYNFQAQSGIELSLNKGELVTLTRRVDENWFEGKIANRKGIFPVSYVEVLTDIGAEDIAARTVITEQASVTNLRPSLDALRTNINNEFNLITKNGHQPPNGILKETKHHNNKIDALHVDTHSEPLVYRALYKYRPQNSDEMELLEGDIVHVLEICDDGWFVGTSQRTGCFGTFPGNYVERVR